MITKLAEYCVEKRVVVVTAMLIVTAIMGFFANRAQIKTIFHDLLPVGHEYIHVNDAYKETFGGSNIVSIMIEVEEGDIFRPEVLKTIQTVTNQMQYLQAVNPFQIISLGSRKLKQIKASTFGIDTEPLMWPELPKNQAEIEELRESVLSNPLVYGRYVSFDLKSALVEVDFIDHLIDQHTIFEQLRKVKAENEGNGVRIRIIGEPVLTGWVLYYLPETLNIFVATLAVMSVLLFLMMRTLRGVILPMAAGAMSAAWALGVAGIFGINFDPLIVVIAFLVTARVVSHSVQLMAAFNDEIARGEMVSSRQAAKVTIKELFRPGMLGVATDAAAVLVVATMPMPLMQKTAVTGAVWVSSIALTGVILTPVLLSWVPDPRRVLLPVDINRLIQWLLVKSSNLVFRSSRVIIATAVLVLAVSGYFAFQITVGDAAPGSPVLWPDSEYNLDAKAINDKFQGGDRIFVVAEGKEENFLKQPATLTNMDNFQRYLEAQPEIGGSVSLVDLLEPVNASLHEGNRRFEEFSTKSAEANGELAYMYLNGADPGDIDRFSDAQYRVGSVRAFFRDHKGSTIRTAIFRIKQYIHDNPLVNGEYKLAGGLIGVLAAVNEEIFRSQVESIALALLVLFVLSALAYRSTIAGLFFLPLVLISNAVTFAFMTWKGIGMNINTLPVAALGIGLGVDYAFYIVDGVKERFAENGDVSQSLRGSLLTAGRGVFITGSTMIVAVLMWYSSSLRFQADMGLLIALWLTVSAISSLLLIPSMIYVFRPAFIFGDDQAEVTNDAAAAAAS